MMRRFWLIALAMATPAMAEMSLPDRAAMRAQVQEDNAAYNAGDYGRAMEAMPPALIEEFARQSGMSVDAFLAQAEMAHARAMSGIEIESQDILFDQTEYGTTSAGRDFAVFPIINTVRTAQGRIRQRSVVLAFREGDRWYQVNVGHKASVERLVAAYPDFANHDFPAEQLERLDD
ncbi:MAG: hypothetical protein K8F31_11320 [Roseovarius sp.]|nr:hypothetical protein [Roseovarius sp.]